MRGVTEPISDDDDDTLAALRERFDFLESKGASKTEWQTFAIELQTVKIARQRLLSDHQHEMVHQRAQRVHSQEFPRGANLFAATRAFMDAVERLQLLVASRVVDTN